MQHPRVVDDVMEGELVAGEVEVPIGFFAA